MEEELNRRSVKAYIRDLLETAEVPAKNMTALYMGLLALLSLIADFSGTGLPAVFLSILTWLLAIALDAGYALYCMGVCAHRRVEYMALFDGFSLIVKLFMLQLVQWLFIFLWSLLFVIPGIVAAYRYRFAVYNLLENPELDVMEALEMSKRQTMGYKSRIFMLDMSYLPWGILASAPAMVYNGVITNRMMAALDGLSVSYSFADFYSISEGVSRNLMGLSESGWNVVTLLFGVLVSLFYLAEYRCSELVYFADSRRTSGIGTDGPWDMGGIAGDDPFDL